MNRTSPYCPSKQGADAAVLPEAAHWGPAARAQCDKMAA